MNINKLRKLLLKFNKPVPDKLFEDKANEKFARLRSQLESKSVMDGVDRAHNGWYDGSNALFPSDELLQAARHYHLAGDPRGEILDYHANMVDGFKKDDPHFQHVTNSTDLKSITGGGVQLPDGSNLYVQNHGHYQKPGVHTISFHWTPFGGSNTYNSYHHPDEARGLADRFGEADPQVGQQIHDILNRGEDHAEKQQPPQKFSKVTERDFHEHMIEQPEEKLHGLAYADWLQDQGMEAHAQLIREHINRDNQSVFHSRQLPYGLSSDPGVSLMPDWSKSPQRMHRVGLTVESPNDPNYLLQWYSESRSPKDALELANRLAAEGANVNLTHSEYREGLQRAKNSKSQPPVKFNAYKAPAGGMIVGNTFYPGGSLVPDLQKQQFAADSDPKPKKKKKKRKLSLQLLKKIVRGGTQVGSSCGEGYNGE